jgi:hypothetical protein
MWLSSILQDFIRNILFTPNNFYNSTLNLNINKNNLEMESNIYLMGLVT